MKSKLLSAVLLIFFSIEQLFAATPNIVSFSPGSGPIGTLVAVVGTDLDSPTGFTIGGVSAVVVSRSSTQLVGMVMPGATTGVITITTSDGSANSNSNFSVDNAQFQLAQKGGKLLGTDRVGNPDQGTSVAISADGNTMAIGGPLDNGSKQNCVGATWIFVRSGGSWVQQGNKLVGSGAVGYAQQGTAVALSADGNTLLVGGPKDNGSIGATWVFVRTAGAWSQQAKLIGSGTSGGAPQEGFYAALNADGNTAIVAGPNDGPTGSAWVFVRSGEVWSQQGSKLSPSRILGAVSLSADGNTALIGAPSDNNGLGATFVYTRIANIWYQQSKLVGTGSGSGSAVQQGAYVALSADGNTAAASGPGNLGDAGYRGAVWVFVRNNAGIWSQQGTKLITTGFNGNPNLGAVSLSGDGNMLLIGGAYDTPTGSYGGVGATWLFTRYGGQWIQQGTKLVGTGNSGASNQGVAVSLSADGRTAAVGGNLDNFASAPPGIGATWVFAANLSKLQNISFASTASTTYGLADFDPGAIANSGLPITYNSSNLKVATIVSNKIHIIGAGSTVITASQGGNSTFVAAPTVSQTLTVLPASLTIAVNNTSKFAGQQNPMFTVRYVGFVNGDDSTKLNPPVKFATTATVSSPPGTYLIVLGIPANPNYLITQEAGTLTINPAPAPTITSYSPSSGSVGTLVKITGTNLDSEPVISIGGKPAIIVSYSGTQLQVMVMPGATTGLITVNTQGGTANGGSFTVNATSFPQQQQGNKLVGTGGVTGSAIEIAEGHAVAVSADGNTAVVGGHIDNNETGAIWVYSRNGSTWTQQGGKLVGTGYVGKAGEQGQAVAISADGNTIIEGGANDNSGAGAAWVFTRTGGVWTQQAAKLVGTDRNGSSSQGCAVSLSADGNTAAVGGFRDANNGNGDYTGAVWIFTRNSGVWAQQGNKLVGTGTDGLASQGYAVALSADGNTLIEGGNTDHGTIGAAWIFTRRGDAAIGGWSQQGDKLVGLGYAGFASQGSSVAVSADGSVAIVGGPNDNVYNVNNNGYAKGAVWIFERNGTTWTQQGSKLVGTGSSKGTWQGSTVSISADGTTAIVGGFGDAPYGAAWIFKKGGSGWAQQGVKLVGSGAVSASYQGRSVAISSDGSTAIIGGDYDNAGVGAAWAFVPGPAAPAISYATPQTWFAGKAIAALPPVSNGGSVAPPKYRTAAVTVLDTGLFEPTGLAADAEGSVYVCDSRNNLIKKIHPDGSVVRIGSTFHYPRGVAVDRLGNVYVADYGRNAVKKILPNGGGTIVLGSGFVTPAAVAVDAAGNVYVADSGNNAVKEIPAGGGAVVTLATGFNFPAGIALDAAGNIYVADKNNNAVKEIPAGGGSKVTVASGLNLPYGVAIDASGNLFISSYGNGTILEIPSGSGTPIVVANTSLFNKGIAVDGLGNIYVSDSGVNQAVRKIQPAGGYYISKPLPAAVAFDQVTGAFNGVPAVAAPAADYKITAYNTGGSNTTTVNITVTWIDPILAALAVSNGTLSPAFTPALSNYTDTVRNDVASITFTPSAAYAGTTIKINGVAVPSGTVSGNIPLSIGVNTISISAVNIGASATYTVKVTRLSSNGNLANLAVSNGHLSPAFAPTTDNYTDTVSNVTTYINITPSVANPAATVKINGVPVASGSASDNIPLSITTNPIWVKVTAEDGTVKTYSIKVTRLSNNANLNNLTLSSGTLSPAFVTATKTYTSSVSNGISSVTVTPTLQDATAKVSVNGISVSSGRASGSVVLAVGDNTITIITTAQDGVTAKTFTVTVNRAMSGLNSLFVPGSEEKAALVSAYGEKIEPNNILSPNGDGVNDFWVIKNILSYPDNTVTVYDSEGKVVFTKKGYLNDWNGSYRGSLVNAGTYYYTINLGNGVIKKGFITVMRE